MTPQESQLLREFLDQLMQVRGVVKDPQADEMINRALARQPDAGYLLVQKALLQEQALNAAKAQIAALQSQLDDARASSAGGASFLDSASNWGNSAGHTGRGVQRAAPQFIPQAAAQYGIPPQPAAMPSRPGFFGGGAGSFLGNMAATAAGVAGGAFLFQGIENLLGHHHASDAINRQGIGDLPPETGVSDSSNAFLDTGSEDASEMSSDGDLASDAGIDDIPDDDSPA